MSRSIRAYLMLPAALLLSAAFSMGAQTPAKSAAPAPAVAQTAKRTAPQPQLKQADGAAPNKVWVNAESKVYHCPGARYYGRTKKGSYMLEADAIKAGFKAAHGDKCFK